MPEPAGFVVKNGTNRFAVFGSPGPSSSILHFQRRIDVRPRAHRRASGFERRVDRIPHKIDQQLLELVGVGRRSSTSGPLDTADRQPRLERDDAAHERCRRRSAAAAAPAVEPVARTRS